MHRRPATASGSEGGETPAITHYQGEKRLAAGRRRLAAQRQDIAVGAAVDLLGARLRHLARRELHHRPASVRHEFVRGVKVGRVADTPILVPTP